MVKYLRAFLPISTPLDLFAFRHTVTDELENGWKLYDPLKVGLNLCDFSVIECTNICFFHFQLGISKNGCFSSSN